MRWRHCSPSTCTGAECNGTATSAWWRSCQVSGVVIALPPVLAALQRVGGSGIGC